MTLRKYACPPVGENTVVLYTLSREAPLAVKECNQVRRVIENLGVKFSERGAVETVP